MRLTIDQFIYWRWGHTLHTIINMKTVVSCLVKRLHNKNQSKIYSICFLIYANVLIPKIAGNYLEMTRTKTKCIRIHWIGEEISFVSRQIAKQLNNLGRFRSVNIPVLVTKILHSILKMPENLSQRPILIN